ncbi:hypothetical protein HK405_001718, partial [Cladochytrium tenue]
AGRHEAARDLVHASRHGRDARDADADRAELRAGGRQRLRVLSGGQPGQLDERNIWWHHLRHVLRAVRPREPA